MKRRCLIPLAIVLAGVAVGGVLHFRPRPLPLEECSAVYRHYADNPGLKMAYMQAFPLNDSISVAVTTLQATDSTGWALLEADFRLPHYPPEVLQLLMGAKPSVSLRHFSPLHPLMATADSAECTRGMVAVSVQLQTVCVFHISDEAQQEAVVAYKARELKNMSKIKEYQL